MAGNTAIMPEKTAPQHVNPDVCSPLCDCCHCLRGVDFLLAHLSYPIPRPLFLADRLSTAEDAGAAVLPRELVPCLCPGFAY